MNTTAQFIFMLTKNDATVAGALEVYEASRDLLPLQHVGFKDVGADRRVLRHLTDAIHADGRTAYLEIVSQDPTEEARAWRLAVDLGVDVILGGIHVDALIKLIDGSAPRYFPFVGKVVGHPSNLRGTPSEIVRDVERLTQIDGVDGFDLLAYRTDGDPLMITEAVVGRSRLPVVIAGSIDSPERIDEVIKSGAWGFTVGGAIFAHRFPAGPTVREQLEWINSYVAAKASSEDSRTSS